MEYTNFTTEQIEEGDVIVDDINVGGFATAYLITDIERNTYGRWNFTADMMDLSEKSNDHSNEAEFMNIEQGAVVFMYCRRATDQEAARFWNKPKAKCECGCASINWNYHSDHCPLYGS